MSLLEIRGLEASYGSTRVLHGVDLAVGSGEVVCLLGRNGVGKTTLLRAAMGLIPRGAGSIRLDGDEVGGLPPYAIARRRVSYAAQDGGLFTSLTVRDNLRLGSRARASFGQEVEEVGALFPVLVERLSQKAGTLSGGEQKMLLAARALMGGPRLALLDEVTEGVQPSLLPRMAAAIGAVSAGQRVSILLVEQNVSFALAVASRFYVMEKGRIVETGPVAGADADDAIHRYLVLS
jgi:ABC-type branched-subunit amino acid transport system ATPase component